MTGLGTSVAYINQRANTTHYVELNIRGICHKQVTYKNVVEAHKKTCNSIDVIGILRNFMEISFYRITVLA